MNRRNVVIAAAGAALSLFVLGAWLYSGQPGPGQTSPSPAPVAVATSSAAVPATVATSAAPARLTKPVALGAPYVRPHSPVLGPAEAPVTIIEFFDPACEACRAFYPIVKQIMDRFPGKVRVVLRYAAFHRQSQEAVSVLEAARRQDRFEPVLVALLKWQPAWAPHGREGTSFWGFVSDAGLDIKRAQEDMASPEIAEVKRIDADDIKTLGVRQTPTFYVNGKPLQTFSAQGLLDLVKQEVEAQ